MDESSLQQLLTELPEAGDLLRGDAALRWADAADLSGVLDELRAMRQSESLGYLHHAELHQAQALALLRKVLAEQQ